MPVSRGTVSGASKGENTWNSDLTEELRGKYPSADFELLFPTLRGLRKPDVCFRGPSGAVVISGKLGASKEVEAIATAQEYQQVLGEVGIIQETFGVTYPAKPKEMFHLRVLATSKHSSMSWSLISLRAVADKIIWVAESKFEEAALGLESSVTATIRVLRKGVADFTDCLAKSETPHVEEIFGGKEFFESVTGFEGTKKNKDAILRSAAAYLFLNQVLFYETLAEETKKYKPIDPSDYSRPEVLKVKYFDLVLKDDYKPIFAFDVVAHLRSVELRDASKKIILAAKALLVGAAQHDTLGKVFHELIPLEFRKTVAAYFTNSEAGDLLASISIDKPDARVMDPACGSGTLLVSAYKRKLELAGGHNSKELHKKYVENELTGVDIMAFSAHLAAVHLALQAPLYETDSIRIAIEDSTTLTPGAAIDSARKAFKDAFKGRRLDDFTERRPTEMIERGGVDLGPGGSRFILDQVDLVIMNPPFTSNANLPARYREELKHRFTYVAYKKCLTGKISFQAHFILLADKFLTPEGRLACVLPFTTFTGKAFDNLVKFLLSRYSIKCIIVGLGRSAFSENTSLTEILLVAEKNPPSSTHKFALVGTKTTPTAWNSHLVSSISQSISSALATGRRYEDDVCIVELYSQDDLDQSSRSLTGLVTDLEKGLAKAQDTLLKAFEESGRITTLSSLERELGFEYFAYELANPDKETKTIGLRGAAYFGLSALVILRFKGRAKKKVDRLVVKSQKGTELIAVDRFKPSEEIVIPKKVLSPCFRTISGISTMDSSGKTDWIVRTPFRGIPDMLKGVYDEDKVPDIQRRIENELEAKVKKGSSNVCLARKIDLSASGTRVLATYSKERAFLMADSWGFRNLPLDDAKLVTMWLNSTLFLGLLVSKRSRTRGAWGRFDAGQLDSLPFIDLTKLSSTEKRSLLRVFDEYGKTELPSILEQLETNHPARMAVDDALLTILGMEDRGKRRSMILKLHKAIYSHLLQMKETMKKDKTAMTS